MACGSVRFIIEAKTFQETRQVCQERLPIQLLFPASVTKLQLIRDLCVIHGTTLRFKV